MVFQPAFDGYPSYEARDDLWNPMIGSLRLKCLFDDFGCMVTWKTTTDYHDHQHQPTTCPVVSYFLVSNLLSFLELS